MMLTLLGAVVVMLLLWWRHRRRRAHQLASTPLAGRDTGVRSAYRTPARRFTNRRTL